MKKTIHTIWILTLALALPAVGPGRATAAPDPARHPAGGQDETALLKVLQSGAPLAAKARACEGLAVVGGTKSVPVLAGLLGQGPLGEYARLALEAIEDDAAGAALRAALGRLKGQALAGVATSLGTRRDGEAVAELIKLVADPASGAAEQALAALGLIASDEAIACVTGVLADGPDSLRAEAGDAALKAAGHLVATGRRTDALTLCEKVRGAKVPACVKVAATYNLLVTGGEAKVDLLIQLLAGQDPAMRAAALQASRAMQADKVTAALVEQARNAAPAARALLVPLLAERKGPGIAGLLNSLGASSTPAVRLAALRALATAGDQTSVGVLVAALAGGDEQGRALAGTALRAIHGRGVDQAILAATPSAPPAARAELLRILTDRHHAQAVPLMMAQTRGTDAEVVQAAWRGLGQLAGGKDLLAATALLRDLRVASVRPTAERALTAVLRKTRNAPTRFAPLEKALLAGGDRDGAMSAALRIIGGLGTPSALKYVSDRVMWSAVPHPVRGEAIRVLANWPTPAAAKTLLRVCNRTNYVDHHTLALQGYVRLSTGKGVPPGESLTALKDAAALAKSPQERKLLCGALGRVEHAKALALLGRLLKDEEVAAEAALAAVQVAENTCGQDPALAAATMQQVQAATRNAGLRKRAAAVLKRIARFEDYVTGWQICGPFTREGKDYAALFDIPLGPEVPQTVRTVDWEPIGAGTNAAKPWLVDVLKRYGGEQRVAYLRTWVHSPKAQPARLEVGSDDGVKVWLNGKLVHAKNAPRAAVPGEDKVSVQLREGWNAVQVKLTQNVLGWELVLRFRTPDGGTIPDLRVRPERPG